MKNNLECFVDIRFNILATNGKILWNFPTVSPNNTKLVFVMNVSKNSAIIFRTFLITQNCFPLLRLSCNNWEAERKIYFFIGVLRTTFEKLLLRVTYLKWKWVIRFKLFWRTPVLTLDSHNRWQHVLLSCHMTSLETRLGTLKKKLTNFFKE